MAGPLLFGAQGRFGRRLRRGWPADAAPPVCISHAAGPGVDRVWPGTGDDPPPGPAPRAAIVLSGAVPGGDVRLNAIRAAAAVAAARRWGADRILVASSGAVYGPTAAAPMAEGAPCRPAGPYGAAKLAMEGVVAGPGVTCLRIGNVAGASQPFDAIVAGTLVLDRFADGAAPSRSFVGPVAAARILVALVEHAGPLPPLLNLASPDPISMEEIARARGVDPAWRPAPEAAIRHVHLDIALLAGLVSLPGTDAPTLWAEVDATAPAHGA